MYVAVEFVAVAQQHTEQKCATVYALGHYYYNKVNHFSHEHGLTSQGSTLADKG